MNITNFTKTLQLVLGLLSAFILPTEASELWKADPVNTGVQSFGGINVEGTGSVTVVDDPTYGKIYIANHAADCHRSETSHLPNDLHAKEGDVWYIGWRFKLSMPQNTTTNAIFQWKSYPAGQQNWPIVLSTDNGNFLLRQRNPGNVVTTLWQKPAVVGAWQTVVVCISVSRDISKGYLEFWFNGVKQQLLPGSDRFVCRTLDDGDTDPKWGIYGADGTQMSNSFCGNTIATTFDEADPNQLAGIRLLQPSKSGMSIKDNQWNPILFQRNPFSFFNISGRRMNAIPSK